ncbi:MAG: hypothetical protein J6S14_13540 [Clostridia bacterium]|nr:hypothetical protein [Clostridia bacterium]
MDGQNEMIFLGYCPMQNMLPCLGEHCSWFDEVSRECAVLSIADSLSEHNERHSKKGE